MNDLIKLIITVVGCLIAVVLVVALVTNDDAKIDEAKANGACGKGWIVSDITTHHDQGYLVLSCDRVTSGRAKAYRACLHRFDGQDKYQIERACDFEVGYDFDQKRVIVSGDQGFAP